MADNKPARRIDREALDRIIQRAAELQAGEIDTTEGLTEQELLKLGADVGIDGRYLRQALYENQAGGGQPEKGLAARWFGPARLTTGRVINSDRASIESQLAQWMTEGEALAVKRKLPDRTVWERQRGFLAEMKRGFGMGGKQYVLARATDISAVITPLEPGYCHIELSADIGDMRGSMIGGTALGTGALALAGGGLYVFIATVAVFPFSIIAAAPLAATAAVPWITSRVQKRRAGEMLLALEQVLDRLEQGEIKPKHLSGGQPILRLADEIRKAITDGMRK